MTKIKDNTPKPIKIVVIILAFIILTMTMIFNSSITKNFPYYVYAQSLGNETNNMNTKGNILDKSFMNVNVSKIDIPDAGNMVPNQYIVILKENATFSPQSTNNTVSSLSEEWSDYGLNITSFPEVGMLTIDLNQTLAQEDEASVVSVEDVLSEIQNNPNVDYIEPNQIFGIE